MTSASPDLASVQSVLEKHNQQHLLQFTDRLSAGERAQLAEQIRSIDFALIASIFAKTDDPEPGDAFGTTRAERAATPKHVIRQPKSPDDYQARRRASHIGDQLLSDGKIAVLTVAGGQGTRLGFDLPKGMFPIGPRTERTLFQIFAEQILARRRRHNAPLPWYLMTSDATHADTIKFFEDNDYFDLGSDTVTLFQQGSLPAVDLEHGRILLESPSRICLSPDGHGGTVSALHLSGCLQQMAEEGVEHIYYHQVDNPTAIIADPVLLGLHAEQKSQLTTNVVRKSSPGERMGVLVDIDSRTEIIEYSELTEEQSAAEDEHGQWIFWAGNTAIHVFRRDFLEYLAEDGIRLPLHQAHKKVAHLDDSGNRIEPDAPNAVKFERFIFDALPLAERTLIVEGDREREFNPVKNATGSDSPETSRSALNAIGRDWLAQAGHPVSNDVAVEISPLLALDAEELAARLNNGDIAINELIG